MVAYFLAFAAILPMAASQHFPPRQQYTWPDRVYPGTEQFPSRDAFFALADTLDGEIVHFLHPDYASASAMYNFRVQKFPEVIFEVESAEDVQKVINFSRQYNLMVTVLSSGHSFIGRSTHDGCMMISLKRMKHIKFNLNSDRNAAGEVTVSSGCAWLEVYTAVDQLAVTQDPVGNQVRRVVVGGSAHTVAIGGYTQGGGHSPMSRSLGLAVDSLLDATIILADGRKAEVSAEGTTITDLSGSKTTSNDTSLFWALRGGGGGTWGVVTDFTFKLHNAPQRFRRVAASWSLLDNGRNIGSESIRFVMQEVAKLSRNWGGYVTLIGGDQGSVNIFLNHFGSDHDPSNTEVNGLLNHNVTGNQLSVSDVRYDTFLDYEKTALDPPNANTYIFNTFVQPELVSNSTQLDAFVSFLMSLRNLAPDGDSIYTCTGTLLGGKTNEVPEGETPVNPSFRSALMSLTCALSWTPHESHSDEFYIKHALLNRDRLAELGDGTYFNECAEDLDDWQTAFWGKGDTYNRLLDIKRKWDPNMFFWCHNCVGSDVISGQK